MKQSHLNPDASRDSHGSEPWPRHYQASGRRMTRQDRYKVPLYKYLTSRESNPQFGGDIKWNFTRFLISRAGRVINRLEPDVEPDSTDTVKAIEEELAKR